MRFEEGCAHSKDGCGTVRREFSSPGLSHLVFRSSLSSSCQLSQKRVEVQEGRAGEGKKNMRYQIYFAITRSLRLEMSHNNYIFIFYSGKDHMRPETTAPLGICCTLGYNHKLFPIMSHQWVHKPISRCLRTLYNKQSKIVKTWGFGLNLSKNLIFHLSANVALAIPLKARDAHCRLKIGGKEG